MDAIGATVDAVGDAVGDGNATELLIFIIYDLVI
jgi:hypothetical protein